MLTVAIARRPSTYIICSFLLCNSILEKLYFLLLNVESGKFLLPLSSWIFAIGVVATIVASVTTTGVTTARGRLRCYMRELVLVLLHFCQQNRDLGASFKALSFILFVILIFFSLFQVQKCALLWWLKILETAE